MSGSKNDKEMPFNEEPEYVPSVINAQAINSDLRTAQISIFIGFLLDGICGLYLYNLIKRNDVSTVQIILLVAAIIFGAVLLMKGIVRILSVKSIGKYVSVLRPNERTDITVLARSVRKSEQKVLKELENIFKRAYLHGSIDIQTQSVTLTKK